MICPVLPGARYRDAYIPNEWTKKCSGTPRIPIYASSLVGRGSMSACWVNTRPRQYLYLHH
ncbi:hypothetical protein OH492_14040 [Vibrio chagasii]|nr:hypothetical protein [Vibrio chagasii]